MGLFGRPERRVVEAFRREFYDVLAVMRAGGRETPLNLRDSADAFASARRNATHRQALTPAIEHLFLDQALEIALPFMDVDRAELAEVLSIRSRMRYADDPTRVELRNRESNLYARDEERRATLRSSQNSRPPRIGGGDD